MSEVRKAVAHPQKVWAGLILKGLLLFFSWMPLRMNRIVGSTIGYLLWWIPNSQKRIAQKNIAVVYPQLSPFEQSLHLKKVLIESAKATTELGPAWLWSQQKLLPLIKEVKGQGLLANALARKKGVIFLAPHLGSWELIGPYLSSQYASTFMYRPPNIPSIESFMVKARGRFGAKLAPTDVRGVRSVIKALKNNEVTAILPDQDPGESGGVYAPFFNRPARTMTLVSKLIQKTDCAFLFVVMERLPNAEGYRLHFLPAAEEIGSTDELVATTALNAGIEACIALEPEQYLWSYKRFRKPPPGVVDIYKS